MRITAGANAWRKVVEVMRDRRVSDKCKGHLLSSSELECITDDDTNRETTGEEWEKIGKNVR